MYASGLSTLARVLGLGIFLTFAVGCSSSTKQAESVAAPAEAAPADQAAPTTAAAPVEKKELVVSRVFDAPVKKVWKAWTDCAQLKRWWGPKGYSTPACKMDVKVGGKYLIGMKGKEGPVIYSTGTYTAVEREKLYEVDDSFGDEKGNVVPATHYGLPADFPLTAKIKLTFAAEGKGKTLVTMSQADVPVGPMHEMASVGWNESFDKLAAALKK